MLKIRHFPGANLLSDHSDIVALHAQFLRRNYASRFVTIPSGVEDRVTVLTYDRARCPILNQVPHRTRCALYGQPLSSPIFEAFRRIDY
jgi:hypothetical protein